MQPSKRRLAIVTGAAGGLGRAFCRRLAASGDWHIVAADVDAVGTAETARLVSHSGAGTAQPVTLDVADAQAWHDLRQQLSQDWPQLHLLINNAGVCMAADVGDGALADWRRVFEVNFLGVLHGCHAMTPWLKESAAARPAVINVASIFGLLAAPSLGAYGASKAAVAALTESMYAELRPLGVNVTLVAPGFFPTGLLEHGVFAIPAQREQADRLARTAAFSADDVAAAALAASRRGRLYVVLGRRARWLWRLKRLAPVSLLGRLARRYRLMIDAKRSSDLTD